MLISSPILRQRQRNNVFAKRSDDLIWEDFKNVTFPTKKHNNICNIFCTNLGNDFYSENVLRPLPHYSEPYAVFYIFVQLGLGLSLSLKEVYTPANHKHFEGF